MRVEWRLRDGEDVLLLVDDADRVQSEVLPPDDRTLKSYLATGENGATWTGWGGWRPISGAFDEPDAWGELVLSRADSGAIIFIDPERFWERVHRRFRSRGVDFGP